MRALARRRLPGRLLRLDRRRLSRRDLGWILGVVSARHRIAKVPNPAPEGAANLGQALGTENHKRNHKDEQQMGGLKDVPDHA